MKFKKILIINLFLFFSFKANSNENNQNIILMIGDGMGMSQITYEIMKNKRSNFHQFKDIGLIKTFSKDQEITDSAASATAFATGRKTNNTYISVDEKGRKIKTIFEQAKENGYSTGFLVTSSVVHATPAAFYSHQISRKLYENIALDLLNSNTDFIIGGGTKFFNERSDNQDLLQEFKNKNYKIYTKEFGFLNSKNNKKAIILLSRDHLKKAKNRNKFSQIRLLRKTLKELKSLNKPFIFLVEGSQIDWGGHKNDEKYILEEMLEFDNLIGEALNFAKKDKNTLVLVTSDHESGGMTLVGKEQKVRNSHYGSVHPKFSSSGHSAVMVPIFAYGKNSDKFKGIYQNNKLYDKMTSILSNFE